MLFRSGKIDSVFNPSAGVIKGMEALIRWELEPYGVVSPGIFMEWLEQDPCIFDLGNWIIRTALSDIKRLRRDHPDFFVNVNIAAAQLERKEFRDSVLSIIKETNSTPDELCLELTERCRDLDVNFLKNEVNFFRSHGIKIALDDFGTGNSSLSLALELPFDELKVDSICKTASYSVNLVHVRLNIYSTGAYLKRNLHILYNNMIR